MKKKIKNTFTFLNETLKNTKNTGAITESSVFLADKITNICDLSKMNSIVELGSGTGIFTKKILEKKGSETKFFILEINDFFIKETLKNNPDATIYLDDAKNIKKYLEKNSLKKVDCIISGLPWSCFDEKSQKDLLENIYDSLEDGGYFLTFSYLQSKILKGGRVFNKIINEKFKNVSKSNIVWKNIPPAFVYICKK